MGFPALHRHHSGTGRKDTQDGKRCGKKLKRVHEKTIQNHTSTARPVETSLQLCVWALNIVKHVIWKDPAWRHSMLEKCRSRPLLGAFVACSRNGRSKNAGSCLSIIGIIFFSAPSCFVHDHTGTARPAETNPKPYRTTRTLLGIQHPSAPRSS